MKEINIAQNIIKKRKEKGITQDDLANFIGVSKASVSKWETGQSYPDIVFLPQLAAYFNISLDELMGYEPQMTHEDIRKLYKELSTEFAERPFDEVKNRCHEIIKKYFSCFPLLFQMGVLFVNYGWTSKNDEQKAATLAEAKKLFIRVKEESNDLELKHFALNLEATCELMLGNPTEVINLLKDVSKSRLTNEVLLSQAYVMTGNTLKAKTEMQLSIYKDIAGLFGDILHYLTLYTDDEERFVEMHRRAAELIELFNLKKLCPAMLMSYYLAAAQGYLVYEKTENSLDLLEAYTNYVTGDIYPLTPMAGDDFFNLLNEWPEELPFGTAEMPRDEKSIKQSMADGVLSNPAFSVLLDEPRFKIIADKLKNSLGVV